MDISLTALLAQVINFGILFFLFRKFLTKPIVKAIEERRKLIKKIENADKAYDDKIVEAKEEVDALIKEWLTKKEQIIADAGMIANKRREEILDEAKWKASSLIEAAKENSQHLEDELKNNFEKGVKRTSLLVVNKLFNNKKDLKEDYLSEVVKEIINS